LIESYCSGSARRCTFVESRAQASAFHRRLSTGLPPTRGALSNATIRPFVRLSVCSKPLAQKGAFYGYGCRKTLTGNPVSGAPLVSEAARPPKAAEMATHIFNNVRIGPTCSTDYFLYVAALSTGPPLSVCSESQHTN